MKQKATIKYIALLIAILTSHSFASFHINHIFHAPLDTHTFFYNKKTAFTSNLFFSHAKKGYDFNEKKVSILNLDGEYNLNTLTKALEIYNADIQNTDYKNPLKTLNADYMGRNAIYDASIAIQSYGLTFAHEQRIVKNFLFAGFSLPIVHVRTHNRTIFSTKKSDPYFNAIFTKMPAEWHNIELARRKIHQELGLQGNLWSYTGIGDCEFHLAGHYAWEHALMCKRIQLSLRIGGLAPTGIQRDDNFISSTAFGSNGHWTLYTCLGTEIELKQNLTTGIMTSLAFPFSRVRKEQRISIYQEPSYLSPLKKDLLIQPGILWSVAPFITFENLLQGGHLHIKYTYMHHGKNILREVNNNGEPASYLTRTTGKFVTTEGFAQVKRQNKQQKWHDHYMTFKALYNPSLALKKWWYDPHFYALYNYPLGGRGAAQNHHFEFGMVLHF